MINNHSIQIYYWYDDNGNGHKARTMAAMNEFKGLAATEYICNIWYGSTNTNILGNFLKDLETSRFVKNKKIILWVDTNDKTFLYELIFAVTQQNIFLVLVSDTITKDEINEIKTDFELRYCRSDVKYMLVNYGEYSELRDENADINTIYDYPVDSYILGLSSALEEGNISKENTVLLIPNSSNKIGKTFIKSVERHVCKMNSWLQSTYTLKVCENVPQYELWSSMAAAKIIITTPSVTAIEALRLCNHILLMPVEGNQLDTFMTLISSDYAKVYSKQNLLREVQIIEAESNSCENAIVCRVKKGEWNFAKKVLTAFDEAFNDKK